MATYDLDNLIPILRLKIGDTDDTAYRYPDEWLTIALVAGADSLGKWMNFKYLLDDSNLIYRNPHSDTFLFPEDPYGVLEPGDSIVFVIMAAYIILEGSLENSAWDYVSWKDAEISFSNLESSRARGRILEALWQELLAYLKPPTKRLARALKSSLPGYLNNEYETGAPSLKLK
jgi:hypothetical protein